MDDFTDRELLLGFAREGDEGAFAALVSRYGGLVFGAALRRSGDRGLAEETAQNVFTILARKAAVLAGHPALAAWLQKTAAHEAARAAEKEQTRRRTLMAYEKEQSGPEESPGGTWQAALPLLDDAVAALPETDRQVLLLRYWQAQPFKNIASMLGSTAAACEKRAERAVEKLSHRLRRQGVALGATAVAAGLAGTLSRSAASAEVLARLAPAALSAAKLTPAATGWIALLFMKSKLSLALSTLALMALCGTAGWVAGASRSPDRSRSGPGLIFSAAGKTGGTDASAGKGVAGANASTRDRRGQLRALLEAVNRDLLIEDYDPAAKARAAARIGRIAPGDLRAAMELAEGFPGGLRLHASLTALLLQQWARTDGAAACEFALSRVPKPAMGLPPLSDPLKVWASQDPRAAFEWFRGKARAAEKSEVRTDDWMPVSSIRWIMGAWSLRDMPTAVEAFLTLKDKDEVNGAMTGFSEMSGAAASRVPVLDAVMKIKMDGHQGNTLQEVSRLLQQWSGERPAELAAWLDRQEVPASYHGMLGKAVLQGWLRGEPAAAVDWWLKAPGGYPTRSGRMEDIVSTWAASNAPAAEAWLATQALDKEAAPAMASLSSILTRTDPARAWDWALRIPGEHSMQEAAKQAAVSWAGQDKAAAEAAVRASPLDEAVKTGLLKTIATTPPR